MSTQPAASRQFGAASPYPAAELNPEYPPLACSLAVALPSVVLRQLVLSTVPAASVGAIAVPSGVMQLEPPMTPPEVMRLADGNPRR